MEVVGEGLVPLIEKGALESEEMLQLLTKYTAPMVASEIDYLVLGCSHYPYLIPTLKKILPKEVKIIDSGEAVAKQTKAILDENDLLVKESRPPKLQFYTNASKRTLGLLLSEYSKKILIAEKPF